MVDKGILFPSIPAENFMQFGAYVDIQFFLPCSANTPDVIIWNGYMKHSILKFSKHAKVYSRENASEIGDELFEAVPSKSKGRSEVNLPANTLRPSKFGWKNTDRGVTH